MATQLNIKDAETVRMVRDYAAETGRTVTATVRAAIENDRRVRETEIAEKVKAVQEIVAEFQRRIPEEWRGKTSKEIMDSIYDDNEPDGFAK